MSEWVYLQNIKKECVLKNSGHVIHKATLEDNNDTHPKKIIFYKENKHNCSIASQMEMGFSGLASRFLKPKLTSKQKLVIDTTSQQITGLISEHLGYTAREREGENAWFHSINDKGIIDYGAPKPYSGEEKIPVYFFNQLPAGYFNTLASAFKAKQVTFDMASLASVLATSYTLEEDDLHKGNFCFYLVMKENRPHVVFMKIDHDLMMADSVMSHGHARVANWLYEKDAFSITERDLLHFPKLLDSQNHYWPTTKRWLVKPLDPKVYNDDNEMTAFAALSENEEFKRAKWQEFYKHILIPRQLIEEDVAKGFDRKNLTDRAQITLITNAVVARQARLRAVLFSIAEFRDFVKSLHTEEKSAIKKEMCSEIFAGVDLQSSSHLLDNFDSEMAFHYSLCTDQERGFKAGDTPLHTAIRLGDYRHDETWDAFSHFAHKKNADHKTPLELAMDKMEASQQLGELEKDPRKNPTFIVKHLLNQGLKHPLIKSQKAILQYHLPCVHLNKAREARDLDGLLAVFQQVGEDERFTLKMRKDVAICCLEAFMERQANNPKLGKILSDFRHALNIEKRPELQYIRQLRSELWIIRQIRGLLGGTRTQVILTELVDDKLAKLDVKPSLCHRFFNSCQEEETPLPVSATMVMT